MSAAIQLRTKEGPKVLLAGDIGIECLSFWESEHGKTDPRASILVFPHHGGRPESVDPVTFAERLCEAIRPGTVIFSIHRSMYGLPRRDVVQAVRRIVPQVRIACTQLSAHCAPQLPSKNREHLLLLPAQGVQNNSCCAGTILIDLSKPEPQVYPSFDRHIQFVSTTPAALCQLKKDPAVTPNTGASPGR